MNKNWIVFGLSNGLHYAKEIAKRVGIELGEVSVSKFADGELLVKSKVPVRGKDVLIVQSTSTPVNDNLMELLIAIDALKRASAQSIIAVIPYYGYGRQDRKAKGREPITCKLVADFIMKAGATKVILVDIHSEQTQGFFDVPVDTLTAASILINEYTKRNGCEKNFCIVAPDYGAVKKARNISEYLDVQLAIVDKRRPKPNVVEVSNILGDVRGKDCLLIDDMIDTGGTVLSSAKLLKEAGSKKVVIMATHGLFSNNAIEKFYKALDDNIVDELYVTDTIIENMSIKHKKIVVIDLSIFLSEIIEAQIKHTSVSKIYDKYWNNVCNIKKISKK